LQASDWEAGAVFEPIDYLFIAIPGAGLIATLFSFFYFRKKGRLPKGSQVPASYTHLFLTFLALNVSALPAGWLTRQSWAPAMVFEFGVILFFAVLRALPWHRIEKGAKN
jgi:hypothetical protein